MRRLVRSYNYSPVQPYYLNTLIPYYLCPAHIRIVSFCRGTAVGRKRQGLNYDLSKFFRAADYGIFGSVSNEAFPVLSRRMPGVPVGFFSVPFKIHVFRTFLSGMVVALNLQDGRFGYKESYDCNMVEKNNTTLFFNKKA